MKAKKVDSEEVFAEFYDDLRQLAKRRLRFEKPGQTVDATSLVHEVYLRLFGLQQEQNWASRQHFLRAAATAMRRILVDRARRKNTLKLGGSMRRVNSILDQIPSRSPELQLEEIDQCLECLKVEYPDIVRLVELKYFAGFTIEESAEILGFSVRTAHRRWEFAKAWLYDALQRQE